MPLPLIVWGLGAAAAAGLGLGAKAVVDNNKANEINEDAQKISRKAEIKLQETKQSTNSLLENYGKQKLEAFETKIGKFVKLFGQLKNVEIERSTELDNLNIGNFSQVDFADIKESYSALSSITQGFVTGAGTGALAAYGAYTGVMAFGAASTGTAISGLSGVAATNATLAWLGGGSLATGGAGMAGGLIVLGGLVAAPASLIFGGIFAAKASQKVSEALSNKEKAQDYEGEIKVVCQKLSMIQEVTTLASDVLSQVATKSRRANNVLNEIIEDNGTDYSTYTENSKNNVFKALKYAQLLKTIIDSPILSDDGGPNEEIQAQLQNLQAEIA